MGITYWIVVTIVALLHIGFGAGLLFLWQERHIWSNDYLEKKDMEPKIDEEEDWDEGYIGKYDYKDRDMEIRISVDTDNSACKDAFEYQIRAISLFVVSQS